QFLDQGSSDFHGITSVIERDRPAMIAGRCYETLSMPGAVAPGQGSGRGGRAHEAGLGRSFVALRGVSLDFVSLYFISLRSSGLLGRSAASRLGFFASSGAGELFFTHGSGVRSGGLAFQHGV